ncbi:MAG: DNA repair exonuclease [Anaerolineae bacterium]|nr:DNA repair exonuclease [Anaerolineae bacterium]
MPITFMHIADIHLGYQQYGLQERFDDFSRAFLNLVNQAIARQVQFVLLAGDLFEKRTVDPLAMRVAVEGLVQLHEAGIPVLAVEGNHERAYYQEQYSWMDFLDALGYLRLLNPCFEGGVPLLEPHGEDGGAYVDLEGGIRVYGLQYYGASISRAVQGFAEAVTEMDHSAVRYTILMLHAGLEGQLEHVGRLKYNDLAPLRDVVDYVALGHIHKPYIVENWIYNPGSPETNSMDETTWPERGCFFVEICPGQSPPHCVNVQPVQRRAFHRFRVAVDALETPYAVYDAVQRLTVREAPRVAQSSRPVVEVTLSGVLPFNRYDLDLNYVEQVVTEAWSPLVARVHNQTLPVEFESQVDETISRPELERAILQDLLARDARFRPAAGMWAAGALDLKRLVLEGSAPEAVIAHLRRLREDVKRDA